MLVMAAQNLMSLGRGDSTAGENGLGLSVDQARSELLRIKGVFPVLAETTELLVEWEELVLRHSVKGRNAFDARIVASMNVHEVGSIVTFNVPDFTRYARITVLDLGSS